MFPWIRVVVAGIFSWLPTALTLAALCGLAVLGVRNNWKLSHSPNPAQTESAELAIKVVTDPASNTSSDSQGSYPIKRIEFPSVTAIAKAGIKTATVEVRPMAQYVTATGMIDYEPSLFAQLSSRASGTVWSVYKEIGDPIRKGDVLALIEAADVGQAKADFLQSLTQVELRTKTLDSMKSVSGAGSVPERSLREAEGALGEARIRLFNDQQRLLNFGLPFRLAEVQKLTEDQRVRYLRLLGLPDKVRDEVDPETLTANLLPITAPFAGQVVMRNAAPGEVLNTTTPRLLFAVADVRRLHIDLDVRQEDMAFVRKGQQVTFQSQIKEEGAATAKVSHISPEVNEKTRTVQVHAEFANSDGKLRPHTFGTGRILIREIPRAISVPNEAVQWDGQSHLVFVRFSEAAFQARPVRPGLVADNFTEVDGVEEGETVVTVGSHALKSELLKERIAAGD
jgi:cobalt-zinc-cadmium efflux system membrane fusion protein